MIIRPKGLSGGAAISLFRFGGLLPAFSKASASFILLGLVAAGSAIAQVPAIPPAVLPALEQISPGAVQPEFRRPPPAPPAEAQDLFSVPPVVDRPLGIEEGPRVEVKAFSFKGGVDRPKWGIDLKEIEALLTASRLEHPDGYTIGQLQEVANSVTDYYRQAGFILAVAFIPEQTVQQGVVDVQVLEGNLGSVGTEGNSLYSSERLERPFQGLFGEPLNQKNVEEAFLRLSDYPGLTAFGLFRPGEEVGNTDLVLNVQEEERFKVWVQGDNHGNQNTGEWRAFADIAWNNPTGLGDQLSATVLQTFDPTKSTYGSIGYKVPIGTPKYLLGFSASRNAFDVGQEFKDLDIEGTTTIGTVYFRDSFIRSRNLNLHGTLAFDRKSSKVDQDNDRVAEDELSVFRLELGFDHVDTRFAGINQGTVWTSIGVPNFLGSMDKDGDDKSSRIDSDGNRVGGNFTKVAARLARLQSIVPNHTLLLRLEGQWSDDTLTSLEQWIMGGPSSVRAYSLAEFLRDKAVFASAEWIMNAPFFADKPAFANRTWGEVLQLSAYYDYAVGKNNDPLPFEDATETIKGPGVALQLNLPDKLYARADVAWRDGGDKAANDRKPQYWLSLRYGF